MSAFLGPIHYWLYRKIKLQNEQVESILNLAKAKGVEGLAETLNQKYGSWESGELEEIIDGNNIHGWLQGKVSQVEYKLADSVTYLLKEDKASLEELEELTNKEGRKVGESLLGQADLTLPQVYKMVSDSLLDGMPCDRAMEMVKQEADEVIWKKVICVHKPYWEQAGGEIKNYYALRNAWFKGLFNLLNIRFEMLDDNTYKISRGE